MSPRTRSREYQRIGNVTLSAKQMDFINKTLPQ